MSFNRLPALMAGTAAAVVLFATPSFAWYSHGRHYYRSTHHLVVHRTVYPPAPSTHGILQRSSRPSSEP